MKIHSETTKSKLRQVFKRLHFPVEVILTCVCWYVAYPLSLRQLGEMIAERGINVDHSTIHRWTLKLLPVLAAVCRRRKRPVGKSWRMDETYVKINGKWQYLYRAVNHSGATIDFLLSGKRDLAAARSFFERAMALHDRPAKITIDKSGANLAAIQSLQNPGEQTIAIRQSKYLNNVIEQDHRAVKRIVRPMLGFKSFRWTEIIIVGIETMHMIRKGQLAGIKDRTSSTANQFYSLAA